MLKCLQERVVLTMLLAMVDDSTKDRDELQKMVTRYFSAHRAQADCACFADGAQFLQAFAPGKYAVIFLDIYMGELNGMELARHIYQEDPTCRLIFTTTSHTHAVESYDVRAAYYLVKPLEYNRFSHAMDSVCQTLLEENRVLCVHIHQMETTICLADISHVDCLSRTTRIHTKEKTHLVDEPITTVVGMLTEDPRFLICNRNVVVNMDWITQVLEKDFLLRNQIRVPLRQKGTAQLKKDYLRYSLRDLRKEHEQ